MTSRPGWKQTAFAAAIAVMTAALPWGAWTAEGTGETTINVNAMTESDLRAIYKYVRSLGEPDAPVPDYVPPDKEPAPPFVQFPPPPK